jgi:protein-S-isoprenylcysteine O-methyltransferase Ste14
MVDRILKKSVRKKLEKIFGIGPKGAIISLLLFAFFVLVDSFGTFQIVVDYVGLIETIGVILIVSGIGLHIWSFYTLRNWWADDKLCTYGPFKYFRHPMYAAWLTLLCPGLALYLNSWLYLFWIILLHLLWHNLVKKEERKMINLFGDEYKKYVKQTGRFFPRILN